MMLMYRSLAESWRVLMAYRLRSRAEIVANNIRASMSETWTVVSFFYPKDGIGNRLSDEDFREIFFLLTDAYPEEVEDNPDPLDLLTSLSETEITTDTAKSVVDRMHSILEAPDNEVRTWLIRPLFDRISKRDLHPFFMRLSVRASPVRRRDVVSALGLAYDQPFHHIRTAVNLLGLRNTVRDLSLGAFDYSKIRPLIGQPMMIPSPVLVDSVDAVVFTQCFAEIVEGAWVTVHHSKSKTIGFTASGGELPDDDKWMSKWAESISLPHGIYLSDYAEKRDNPLLLVDWLNPDDPRQTYRLRRKVFDDAPSWAIKPMERLDSPALLEERDTDSLPVILRNARGILTYENTIEEVALLNPTKRERVVRVLSGRITESATGGAPVFLWKLGVRDGFDYYPVCETESDINFKRYCASYKILHGEAIKIENPLFVEVEILASGWGDIGAYLNCRITAIAETAGISDCIGVEELGYVDNESR
jgi:hypothetical protein